MKLSVVLPVRDEAPVLPELITRLISALDALGEPYEVIFVDDGSRDSSWALLEATADRDERIRAIRFSRNFGHEIAVSAGLHLATGDAVVTMDSDLQHPPELIRSLLAKAAEGYDVVYAVRTATDSEPWVKRTAARLFYWLFGRLTALDLPPTAGDFRYMSKRAVDALLAMPERHRFTRGLTRWIGYEQTTVEYERQPRAAGVSKYTLRKLVTLSWDAVVSFSSLPLRLASLLGMIFSFLGLVYLAYAIAIRLFTNQAVAGWTSVIAVVIILGGVQLLSLGIMGQYLGRMFDEIKGRPLYLIAEDTSKRDVHTPPIESR